MRMTPLDIRNHRFRRRWRGLDPSEVDQFLAAVSDDVEALAREADALRERAHQLETRVAELEAQEETLRSTLVTAQGISEDLKRTSQREAELRIGEAEVRAEKILDAAHRRASRLAHDIREMRALRQRVASAVRATLDTHMALFESFSGDPDEEETLPDAVAFFSPEGARTLDVQASDPAGETDPERPGPHASGGAPPADREPRSHRQSEPASPASASPPPAPPSEA